jgi:hypothetical protein
MFVGYFSHFPFAFALAFASVSSIVLHSFLIFLHCASSFLVITRIMKHNNGLCEKYFPLLLLLFFLALYYVLYSLFFLQIRRMCTQLLQFFQCRCCSAKEREREKERESEQLGNSLNALRPMSPC